MPLKRVHRFLSRRAQEQAGYPKVGVMTHNLSRQEDMAELHSLRLLSFNIQVGITTQQYGHYLTRSWQHVLPSAARQNNLDRIAKLIRDYDVVALQEADGGSLRSNYINQIQYLAEKAEFPWWYQQLNRDLGHFAQHSNGLLSSCLPHTLEDHKLPGLIPGRGAITAELGDDDEPLLVVVMHLALSRRVREQQLHYIRKVIGRYQHVVLMGDMNAHASQLLLNSPLEDADLHNASQDVETFPSWKPSKSLDHIFLSNTLRATSATVLNFPQSDHLPVAVEIALPKGLHIMKRNVPAMH